MLILFFFFQAEDGIRDVAVTGVQTCALPISRPACSACAGRRRARPCPAGSCGSRRAAAPGAAAGRARASSRQHARELLGAREQVLGGGEPVEDALERDLASLLLQLRERAVGDQAPLVDDDD